MSESNRVKLRAVPEANYGETPTDSADWQDLRYTSESLTASPNTTTSSEIRTDRQNSDAPTVSSTTEGSIDIELSPQSYDDLIAAAMCSSWDGSTGELLVGTEDHSFTIEKEFEDIGKFIDFKGMRVGSMSLSMAYGSIITGSFGFGGSTTTTPTSSAVGAGSSTAAPTTDVLVTSSDVGSVQIDGSSTNICISSISLEVANNLRAIECIGNLFPSNQKKGTANITGTLEMYLSSDSFDLYSTSLENADVSISYEVSDGTNIYNFTIPKAKLQVDAPQSGGLDQDVMLTANYTALYDETAGSSLVITRTPV